MKQVLSVNVTDYKYIDLALILDLTMSFYFYLLIHVTNLSLI